MNAETKRHIDAARQVLVGVVPNPTSQIDQIHKRSYLQIYGRYGPVRYQARRRSLFLY